MHVYAISALSPVVSTWSIPEDSRDNPAVERPLVTFGGLGRGGNSNEDRWSPFTSAFGSPGNGGIDNNDCRQSSRLWAWAQFTKPDWDQQTSNETFVHLAMFKYF
jgi:hypothetical protein